MHEDPFQDRLGLASLLPSFVAAEDFPAKPIRLIVPFPPGGPNDIIARVVGQRMSDIAGQPIIIDNRSGQAGVLTGNALCEDGDARPSPRRRRTTLLQGRAPHSRGASSSVKQEILIAKLDRHGHDTQDAITVFATLKQTQTPHYGDYDRILKELGVPPRSENWLELLNRAKPDTFVGRQTYEPF